VKKKSIITKLRPQEIRRLLLVIIFAIAFIPCAAQQGYAEYINEQFKQYLEDAERGDAVSQLYIGQAYFFAIGAERDVKKAILWMEKAAEQGDADAQSRIGSIYFFGHGVEEDSAKGVYWFRKAAGQGHAASQLNLGTAYFYGHGVKQDKSESLYWWNKAAKQGDTKAQTLLRAYTQ
jgi:TPR repeat protein